MIEGTGFGTSQFQRWYSFKHGKEINSRRWSNVFYFIQKQQPSKQEWDDMEENVSLFPAS